MVGHGSWWRGIARVIICGVLGGAMYVVSGALFAANEWTAYVRFQRARSLGEHAIGDISWWFTERMAAWQVSNHAPSVWFDTWSDRADVLKVRVIGAPAGLRWVEHFGTLGTWGVLSVALLVVCGFGVIVGTALGWVSRREVARACPRGQVRRAIARQSHAVWSRGAMYGGVLGALGWYLGFDRSYETRGLEAVFALPWEGLSALAPLWVWGVMESLRATRISIERCAIGAGCCPACGYPSCAGAERRCSECGTVRTERRTRARVWGPVAAAVLCAATLSVAYAVRARPDDPRAMLGWLAGRSEFMPRVLNVWCAPDCDYAIETGGERSVFRIAERGAGAEWAVYLEEPAGDGATVRRQPIAATLMGVRLGGQTVRVRGPFTAFNDFHRVYLLDLERVPDEFARVPGSVRRN